MEEVKEEKVEAPKQPEPIVTKPVDIGEAPNALDYLTTLWSETHGLSKDQIKENMGEFVKVVDALLQENHSLKKEKSEMEAIPEVQQRKQVAAFEAIWAKNGVEWEDELVSVIPDQMKALAKLGKKKQDEFATYLTNELGNYALPRLAAGKSVSNPLLAISGKISAKITELSTPEKVEVKKPQAPTKPSPKKLIS